VQLAADQLNKHNVKACCTRSGRGGRGRGRGSKGSGKSYWGKGSRKGKGKGKRSSDDNDKENKDKSNSDGAKLDMSLEEVIDKEKGSGKGKGKRSRDGERKGKGKGKRDWGKGNSDWDDDSYSGRGKGKGWGDRKGSKGYSKGGYGGSKGDRGGPPSSVGAAWNQHDDRDEDDDDYRPGRFGRRRQEDDFNGGRPRAWSDSDRGDRGTWQRVEQPRESVREARRGREERVGRSSKAVEPRGVKRRAAEEPESGRSTKSIKVTNIPRDVSMADLRDAFEAETGKITRCRLDRGTAWIAFQTSSMARKAVDTFDRGELNGQNIGVKLDD